MFSIIIRIFGGVVGVAMLYSMIMSGNFSVGQGRFGWLMPLLPKVFILYAIGGLNFFGNIYLFL